MCGVVYIKLVLFTPTMAAMSVSRVVWAGLFSCRFSADGDSARGVAGGCGGDGDGDVIVV